MTCPPPDDYELDHFEEMTMSQPTTPSAPVALKVKWSALVAAIIGLIVTGLPTILANGSIVSGLPWWAMPLIGLIGGGGLTGLAGYAAPHQPRPGDDPAAGIQDGPAHWTGGPA